MKIINRISLFLSVAEVLALLVPVGFYVQAQSSGQITTPQKAKVEINVLARLSGADLRGKQIDYLTDQKQVVLRERNGGENAIYLADVDNL